jgi:hypothetical protein
MSVTLDRDRFDDRDRTFQVPGGSETPLSGLCFA